MIIKFGQSTDNDFVTLRPGDPGFVLHGDVIISQRASFDLDPICPEGYKHVILQAIDRGWLKPIATVRKHELAWELLNK